MSDTTSEFKSLGRPPVFFSDEMTNARLVVLDACFLQCHGSRCGPRLGKSGITYSSFHNRDVERASLGNTPSLRCAHCQLAMT